MRDWIAVLWPLVFIALGAGLVALGLAAWFGWPAAAVWMGASMLALAIAEILTAADESRPNRHD